MEIVLQNHFSEGEDLLLTLNFDLLNKKNQYATGWNKPATKLLLQLQCSPPPPNNKKSLWQFFNKMKTIFFPSSPSFPSNNTTEGLSITSARTNCLYKNWLTIITVKSDWCRGSFSTNILSAFSFSALPNKTKTDKNKSKVPERPLE